MNINMDKKFKIRIFIFLILLIPLYFMVWIWNIAIKYMYLEVKYSNHNPYEQYEKEFNELASKMEEIKPLNKTNIEWRYTLYLNNSKGDLFDNNDLILSNWKNVYDIMEMIWIDYISHYDKWTLYIRTNKWLLWKFGLDYSYYPEWWKNNKSIDERKILKVLNDKWLIYDPYRK